MARIMINSAIFRDPPHVDLYKWVCDPSREHSFMVFIMPEEKKRKLSNVKVVTMIASILEPDDFAEYPYMVGFKC